MTDADAAMVKLYCSVMLGRAADFTVQIYGGMGHMEELPVQRLWRDARLERIWDGGREARGGPRRGGGRSRPDRVELLRVHQLSRSGGPVALRARRLVSGLRDRDRHPEQHALVRPHHEPALGAVGVHGVDRKPVGGDLGGLRRLQGIRQAIDAVAGAVWHGRRREKIRRDARGAGPGTEAGESAPRTEEARAGRRQPEWWSPGSAGVSPAVGRRPTTMHAGETPMLPGGPHISPSAAASKPGSDGSIKAPQGVWNRGRIRIGRSNWSHPSRPRESTR